MNCEECQQNMEPVYGFDGVVTKRQVMGHYCTKCILYVRKNDGREEKTRIIEPAKE